MSDEGVPAVPGYEFIRRGPSDGWSRAAELLYVCSHCGSSMPANHDDYFDCSCGAMYLDVGAARFGSKFGDKAILTYRKVEPT